MHTKKVLFFSLLLFCFAWTVPNVHCTDWPMWGADKGRSFFVKTEISKNLEPLWIRELGEPLHAWPFQFENYFTAGNPSKIGKIAFDLSYEPIAADGKIFVPSMKSDKVTAYSAKDGKEL